MSSLDRNLGSFSFNRNCSEQSCNLQSSLKFIVLLLGEFCRDIKFDSASLQSLTWLSVPHKKIYSILLNQSYSYLFFKIGFYVNEEVG